LPEFYRDRFALAVELSLGYESLKSVIEFEILSDLIYSVSRKNLWLLSLLGISLWIASAQAKP